MAILIGSAIIGLAGITFGNFAVALIVLGLGWNFGFIGGTTMLTETYKPAERGKVQGANDFIMSALWLSPHSVPESCWLPQAGVTSILPFSP